MADPLSIVASSIAIYQTADVAFKAAKNLYNASREVGDLLNEIAFIQALAKQFEALCREPWPPSQQANVDRAEALLSDVIRPSLDCITEIINKHLSNKVSHTKQRTAWVLLKRRISHERKTIHTAREELFQVFQLISASGIRRIAFTVEELRPDIVSTRNTALIGRSENTKRLDDLQSSINDNQAENIAQFEEMQRTVRDVPISLRLLNCDMNEGLGLSRQTASDVRSLLEMLRRSQEPATQLTTSFSGSSLQPQTPRAMSCTLAGMQTTCSPSCSCNCHKKHHYLSSPQSLDRVIGRLFVGFFPGSWTNSRCDSDECQRTKRSVVRLRYRFPTWMLQYSISLTTYLSKHAGPEFLIRTFRWRSHRDSVWDYVALGNVEAVHELFKAGQASVYDIEDQCAHTLLHRAISAKRVPMIKYLLSQGADVDAVDDKTTSCGDKFMAMVLACGMPESQYGPLLQYFRSSSYVEDGQHTLLHRIVFGYSALSLDQVLHDSPEMINTQDAYGRPPLEWAAARGDEQAVKILLTHKADPTIIDYGGWGALHNAVLTDNAEVTRLLLEHGADANHPSNVFLETPLHIAVRFERLRLHVPVLLEYGADASLCMKGGVSPLEFAAGRDFQVHVELLIKATPRSHHMKAYIAAIKNAALRALTELLKQGADLGGVDHTGRTVWHYAALHGNTQVLELLRAAPLLPSLQVQDHAGLTAVTIAKGHSQESEWLETWSALESQETGGL